MRRSEESVETKLQRIAAKACKESDVRFTSLFHLMKEELLRGMFSAAEEGCRSRHRSGNKTGIRA